MSHGSKGRKGRIGACVPFYALVHAHTGSTYARRKKVSKHGRNAVFLQYPMNAGCNCCYDVKTAKPDWNTKRGTKTFLKKETECFLPFLKSTLSYKEMATDVSWADRKRKLASLIGPPLLPFPREKFSDQMGRSRLLIRFWNT